MNKEFVYCRQKSIEDNDQITQYHQFITNFIDKFKEIFFSRLENYQ